MNTHVTDKSIRIIGSGGKGDESGRMAQEDPNDLRSLARATVLDLICEGEIEGFVRPLNPGSCIYLDETPVANDDATETTEPTYNFKDVAIHFRPGSPHQEYLENSPQGNIVSVEVAIPKLDLNGDPTNGVVRTTNNDPTMDAIRIVLYVNGMYTQNKSTGDLTGSEVEYSVWIEPTGASEICVLNHKFISGKTMSKYYRSYDISLANVGGTSPYNIRVERHTDDAPDSATINTLFFGYYSELSYTKLNYPNRCLAMVSVDAANFKSVPKRAYDLKLRRIQVPSNYFPVTRRYTRRASDGVDMHPTEQMWDGTFYTAWSDNPVWCYYDLLTNTRFGLGNKILAPIDKWGLYRIAQYCDVLVPDGFGGTEPRFTLNVYIQTRVEAQKLLNDLTSVFRGMAYWAGGTIMTSCDMPLDPTALFGASNVENGDFVYQGSSRRSRHTVALVTWNNPDNFYKQDTEYVEDRDGILRYGIQLLALSGFGCTSRGQARRCGRWALYSETSESEIVTFKTGLEGFFVRPGEVILVADPARAGVRLTGRIVDITSKVITLDAPTVLQDLTYTIYVVATDGTVYHKDVVEKNATVTAITITTDFDEAPPNASLFMLECSQVVPQTFRVIGLSESDAHQVQVTALAHNTSKYNAIEYDDPLEYSDISNIPNARKCSAPTNVRIITETQIISSGVVGYKIIIAWDAPEDTLVSMYEVRWRIQGSNWETLPSTMSLMSEIPGIRQAGTYEAEVRTVNLLGIRSAYTVGSGALDGGVIKVPDVPEGLSVELIDNKLVCTWTKSTDLTVSGYALYRSGSPDVLIGKIDRSTDDLRYVYPSAVLYGTYTFKLYTLNQVDALSATYSSDSIVILRPSTPIIVPATNGKTCTLSWGTCKTDLDIDYYIVGNSQTAQTAKVTGRTYSEAISWPSKTFSVVAVDVAGNSSVSASSTVEIPNTSSTVTSIVCVGKVYSIMLNLAYLDIVLVDGLNVFETVEIWAAKTNSFASAILVGETTSNVFKHTGISLAESSRYYWARVRTTLKVWGEWYPLSTESGIQGTLSTEPEDYLEVLEVDETGLTATLRSRINYLDSVDFLFDPGVHDGTSFNGLVGAYTSMAQRLILVDQLHTELQGDFTALSSIVADGIANANGSWASLTSIVGVAAQTTNRIAMAEERLLAYDTTNAPTWAVGGTYLAGGFVKDNGSYWRCLVTNTGSAENRPGHSEWTEVAGGLISQWTVKLNANHHAVGVGLTLDGDSGDSAFVVVADKFQVALPEDIDPGGTVKKAIFTVGEIYDPGTSAWITNAVGIRGDLIVKGTILADHIAANQLVVGGPGAKITMGADAEITWDMITDRPKHTNSDNPPVADNVGDTWTDTNDGNKFYRAYAKGASTVAPGQWQLIAATGEVGPPGPPGDTVVGPPGDTVVGPAGERGSLTFRTATNPPTATPIIGDLWFDLRDQSGSDPSGRILKRYNGSSWELVGVNGIWINNTGIYTGALTAEQITAIRIDASQITTGHLSVGRIDAHTIETEHISVLGIDRSVVNPPVKLANGTMNVNGLHPLWINTHYNSTIPEDWTAPAYETFQARVQVGPGVESGDASYAAVGARTQIYHVMGYSDNGAPFPDFNYGDALNIQWGDVLIYVEFVQLAGNGIGECSINWVLLSV